MNVLTNVITFISMIDMILNPIIKLLLLYVMVLVICSLKKYLS
ncbi:hypothetical protein [Tissierella simiarum]|nr:hypothetical protein [Tissierella simiarum]